jgi:ribose transport system permease protein
MRVLVFAAAGVFVALGAFMNAGKIGAVSSQSGVGAEFTVMAGAMLGGIKMGGGGGKINNMVVGVIIIGLLNNGMTLLNMSQNFKNVSLGVILLLAITIDTLQTESAAKRAKLVAGTPPAQAQTGPQ